MEPTLLKTLLASTLPKVMAEVEFEWQTRALRISSTIAQDLNLLMAVPFELGAVCDRMTGSSPQARRPSVGEMPGRCGPCFAASTHRPPFQLGAADFDRPFTVRF